MLLARALGVIFLVGAAQVGRGEAQQQPRDTVPVRLAPVVVTVLRAPLEATRVPYAVAVNTQREIQLAKPGLGLDEALRGIPGVQVDNRFNYALGERISIRGFGARAQFGVRGVRVLVDGIPATLPDGQTTLNHLDLSLLGRAEVLRGPASALYGGNAIGGVIQFETEEPSAVPIGQELGVIVGSDGLLRLHSTTGGQSGRASYLFNAARLTYDGYREFNDAENLHLNGRFRVQGTRDDLRILVNAVDYSARNPGSLSDSLLRVDRSQAFGFNRLQQTGEDGRQAQLGAIWRHQLTAGEIELMGYGLTRELDNPIPPRIIDLNRAAGGFRALFRSRTGPAGLPLQWTVGAEGDLQRDDRINYLNERGERGAVVLDQREGVDAGGVFAQLSGAVTARLSVLGGIRYDILRFDVADDLVTAANPDDSGERTLDAVSPSLGVGYAFSDAVNVYANVATAFETPTTTELANRPDDAGGFNPDLEPQRATSYEIGAKGRLSRIARYEVAVYRANIRDELIPFEVPNVPGRQFFRNAGSATHQGVEAGLSLAPLRGLLLGGSYTYTDAEFDRYRTADAIFDGNRIPGVAPVRAEINASYEARGRWFVAADGRYASEIEVDDANTAASPSYVVADVRAGLDQVRRGRFRLTPFVGVTNLFDQLYNTSVVVNAFGRRYFEPGPGRAVYAGLRLAL